MVGGSSSLFEQIALHHLLSIVLDFWKRMKEVYLC